MPRPLHNPIERLTALLQDVAPRTLVALAGLPGSGKSTLAPVLAEAVNARTAPGVAIALGMDGFHLSRAELSALPNPAEAFARRGAEWTFNPGALFERLSALRVSAGRESVGWPSFVHEFGDPVDNALCVPPSTRLVLVEGIYLLSREEGWQSIGALFDECWYLDTPPDIAAERLMKRHMEAWKMTRDEAAARIATNDRLNAAVVQRSREFADFLVVS